LKGLFKPLLLQDGIKSFKERWGKVADLVADQCVQALLAEGIVLHAVILARLGTTCAKARGGGRCGLAYRELLRKAGGSRETPAHRPPWNRQGNAFSAVPKWAKQS